MSKLTTEKPFKYYEINAIIDGEIELLYGSYDREQCLYELEAERDQWKDQGYKKIMISYRRTEAAPEPEIYEEIAEPILEVGPMTCKLEVREDAYSSRNPTVQEFVFYGDGAEVFSLHANSTNTERLLAHWRIFLDNYEPDVIKLTGERKVIKISLS